jgi:hypothetical protein
MNTSGTAVSWSGVFARDWRVDRSYDYALLYLEDRADSTALGWFGVAWWDFSSSYAGRTASVTGYPGKMLQCKLSPAGAPSYACDGWMYNDGREFVNNTRFWSYHFADQLVYDIDTDAGESGSSVRHNLNGSWVTLGVHWGCDYCSISNNAARFRSSMWNDICSWIGQVPSAFGQHSLCH